MLIAALLLVIALLLAVVGFFLHLAEDIGGAVLDQPSYVYIVFYVAAVGCLIAAVYCGMSHLSVHVSIN